MSEWKEYRLGDICETNKSQYSNKENWHHFKYLDTGNITKGNIDNIQEFDSFESLPSRARRKVTDGDIIYSSVRPNQEHYGYISNPSADILVSTGFIVISANKDIINPIFLYNYLTQPKITKYLQAIGEQSVCTYPAIRPSDIEDIVIKIPSLDIQAIIASILSSLDSKIENNHKICANLEAQAQALFKHWFIDFAPFKDGKFVESELGMIPEGWRVGSILDIAELYDYQRKPLSSMEREDMKGDYPYYGATSIMDYIDKYIFDGTYVLMGEDGSVVKDNGCPYLQYVWGKFWPNNHAHVMQGKNGFSTEMLYCFLSKTDVRSIVTGAVQMKISQRSMSHLLTVIPSKSVCGDYNRIIRPLFDLIKSTKEENDRLSTLRDTLLPKLMSGEIKV